MYELDLKKFWEENETCMESFSTNKKRVPISFYMDDHFVIEYTGIPSTLKYYKNHTYRQEVNQRFCEEMIRLIGIGFHGGEIRPEIEPNRFEVIMGSHWEYQEGGTPWLESVVTDIDDVKKLIKSYEKIDMKKEALPEGFAEAKARYEAEKGRKLLLGGSIARGPATMATSILGTENTCIFMMDEPEIMTEFLDILGDKLVEYHLALMNATGNTSRNPGYSILDDNCYLFTPSAYEEMCVPFLAKLFKNFAPGASDLRHQHSDSEMGHLMPILRDLGVNSVNFGPTMDPLHIRRTMPSAVIHGHMPPFLLRNGTKQEIIDIVRRDIDQIGCDGGLVESPAGSVAGGTPIENILTYMWAVDTYGRY